MGQISKILYEVIPTSDCSVEYAANEYFYQNVAGLSKDLSSEFMGFEQDQSRIRQSVMSKHKQDRPDMSSVIYGPSGTKDNVVLIAKI